MDSLFADKVEKLRAWALAEIKVSTLDGQKMWSESWTFLKYILSLPPDDLKFIASHCSFYGFGYSPMAYWNQIVNVEDTMEVQRYKLFTAGLPAEWHISEPEVKELPFQKGHCWGDKIISADTLRYQLAICNMYLSGITGYLKEISKPILCEVGSGYGAVALELGRRFKNSCYIMIDLPQTLFTAGVYLYLNRKGVKIYLCTAKDTEEDIRKAAEEYDYILVPNNYYAVIAKVNVALFLNMLSFQEMPQSVVDSYVRFFSGFNAVLFSDNWSKHILNPQLNDRVEDVLANYYTLAPDRAFYERDDIVPLFAHVYGRTKTYIGMPRDKEPLFPLGTFKIVSQGKPLFFELSCQPEKMRA